MSNTINEIRTACSWANSQVRDLRKHINANNERYSQFIAEQENKKCMLTAAKIVDDARKEIERVYLRDVHAVEDFYKLDGNAIDDVDMKLLNGNFQLNAHDIAELQVKHAGNGTMMRKISEYADANGIPHFEPSKADRLRVLRELKASADAKLDRIYNNVGVDDFTIDNWPAASMGMGGLPVLYDRVLNGLTLANLNAGDADGDGDGEGGGAGE